ncbi:sporulation-delaying protein SdpB family protein [Subtercola sp. RTI3]|uniref:sporulation-delaying protein SdpB family protein n=1 Tax=Subtercola sp. RTI3 TaxID=3048639 RepID=UPI002B232B28|nr:sporulation-delaying protein SdpB family protein [Subtercola sp. RTI3]MEA9984601.1 hypothetical protein [Subtercola sp. RTI3]
MFDKLNDRAYRWILATVWTQHAGIARSLLAICGLSTLVFSSVNTLIRPAAGTDGMFCAGPAEMSLWCLTPANTHDLAKWASILILGVAASGWRPRLTALPMWWILFGNQSSLTVVDGGDQIAAVLALLLIPISLTDGRRWHWQTSGPEGNSEHPVAALIAHVSIVVVQVQVSFVYLNSCLAKLGVPEWLNGTAIYYWLRDPMFGPAGGLSDITNALMVLPIPAAIFTWGPLGLEFFLGISIFLPRRVKLALLPFGLLFHLGIAVTMGLWSFAFAMWAALLLALWPGGGAVTWATTIMTRMRRPELIDSKRSNGTQQNTELEVVPPMHGPN